MERQHCRQSDGKRVKDGHVNAKKSKRVIPALDQVAIETATTLELNQIVTLVLGSVEFALSKHPAAGEGGSVRFSHTDAGLIMTCKGTTASVVYSNVVYSNEVYNTHIHRIVGERKTAIAPAMMPMLVRALTQYLVHRAMQCIGGGKCDPSTPGNESEGKPMITCGNELTNEMVKDMHGPMEEDGGGAVSEYEFLECMRLWTSADPNFTVDGNRLNFRPGPATAPLLSVDLVGVYDIKYAWIVLHLFMAYVNGCVAQETGTADAQGLTQRNLLLLLEPFRQIHGVRPLTGGLLELPAPPVRPPVIGIVAPPTAGRLTEGGGSAKAALKRKNRRKNSGTYSQQARRRDTYGQ